MYANEETMCLSLTLTDWEKSKWRYKKRTSEKREKWEGQGVRGLELENFQLRGLFS